MNPFFWFARKTYGVLHICPYVPGLRTVVARIPTDYESLQDSSGMWLCVAGLVFLDAGKERAEFIFKV
jgi:hypothetical protein